MGFLLSNHRMEWVKGHFDYAVIFIIIIVCTIINDRWINPYWCLMPSFEFVSILVCLELYGQSLALLFHSLWDLPFLLVPSVISNIIDFNLSIVFHSLHISKESQFPLYNLFVYKRLLRLNLWLLTADLFNPASLKYCSTAFRFKSVYPFLGLF